MPVACQGGHSSGNVGYFCWVGLRIGADQREALAIIVYQRIQQLHKIGHTCYKVIHGKHVLPP